MRDPSYCDIPSAYGIPAPYRSDSIHRCKGTTNRPDSDNLFIQGYHYKYSTTYTQYDDELIEKETDPGEIHRERGFDDEMNQDADASDIRLALIEDYLERVGSPINVDDRSRSKLPEDLRLVRGPPGAVRPLNIGLMMFNRRPDDFFPNARIDVILTNPAGNEMTKRTFMGPVDKQLLDVLDHIRNSIVAERVFKVQDRAEAVRVFNYPFDAIKEAVVNAALHKDYAIPEPIRVTFTTEHAEILSFPGPDPSIADEAIEDSTLISEHRRNERLGNCLKELHLAKCENSGIPRMIKVLKKNGSEPPRFITDPDRTFFKVVIPVQKRFRET